MILSKAGANTIVQFDQDGSAGGLGPVTLATVTSATVTAADFVLEISFFEISSFAATARRLIVRQ